MSQNDNVLISYKDIINKGNILVFLDRIKFSNCYEILSNPLQYSSSLNLDFHFNKIWGNNSIYFKSYNKLQITSDYYAQTNGKKIISNLKLGSNNEVSENELNTSELSFLIMQEAPPFEYQIKKLFNDYLYDLPKVLSDKYHLKVQRFSRSPIDEVEFYLHLPLPGGKRSNRAIVDS